MAFTAIFVFAPLGRADTMTPTEALAIADEAYIYGYPLVTMEMTRRVMTNVVEAEAFRASMGHLIRVREYPVAIGSG